MSEFISRYKSDGYMDLLHDKWYKMVPCGNRGFAVTETLQMGISHFSGLFVLLCVGVAGALLTLAGEHGFFRFILPYIRRRQNLKYWLHTSQKIHRALNMTYEDVKKQRAEREKSCNLEKSQPPPGPAPPTAGAAAKWNNETPKEEATAAPMDARDFKRVHFHLETLNTRRLLARLAASDAKAAVGKGDGPPRPPEPTDQQKPGFGRVCENGGPAPSLASLILSLPKSSASTSSTSTPSIRTNVSTPRTVAPPSSTTAPPTSTATTPPAVVVPPRPGELEELQVQIDEMRERLKVALARRAEIQTTLTKPAPAAAPKDPPVTSTATTTTTSTIATTTTAVTTTCGPVPTVSTVTTVTPLPANTKCVTTMTDLPHKVLSKVRPFPSRLSNERR